MNSSNTTGGLGLREHVPHRFAGNGGIPYPVRATASELGATNILTAATGGLAEDGLQVAALRVEPATDKGGWVLAQGGVERMAGLGVHERLDDQGELVIQDTDLADRRGMLGVRGQRDHLLAEGVVDSHPDVVDGWLRVVVELLVDADGVGKLDRVKWCSVDADGFWDLREEHLVSSKDLAMEK
jgi:hypothetical protein